jgi:enoyl-[acyl-carrier-protein] reductase (NADH)
MICSVPRPITDVAKPECVVFLASDLASFVTGEAVAVDGGVLIAIGGTSFQESGTGSSKR